MDLSGKKVEISVSGNPDTMTQADSQRIKRCSNMLRDNGFNVHIKWGGTYANDNMDYRERHGEKVKAL